MAYASREATETHNPHRYTAGLRKVRQAYAQVRVDTRRRPCIRTVLVIRVQLTIRRREGDPGVLGDELLAPGDARPRNRMNAAVGVHEPLRNRSNTKSRVRTTDIAEEGVGNALSRSPQYSVP